MSIFYILIRRLTRTCQCNERIKSTIKKHHFINDHIQVNGLHCCYSRSNKDNAHDLIENDFYQRCDQGIRFCLKNWFYHESFIELFLEREFSRHDCISIFEKQTNYDRRAREKETGAIVSYPVDIEIVVCEIPSWNSISAKYYTINSNLTPIRSKSFRYLNIFMQSKTTQNEIGYPCLEYQTRINLIYAHLRLYKCYDLKTQ